MDWTVEQLATVLARLKVEPRRNVKRYLKDQGGRGSAEELDLVVAEALANSKAMKLAEEIADDRANRSREITDGLEFEIEGWLDEIESAMQIRKISLGELAAVCGYTVDLMSLIVNGKQRPTTEQLARIAIALRCSWRLIMDDE